MQGRVDTVFYCIQFEHRPLDVLDLFHRSWNAELLRNAAAEPTGCLLRFPLLRAGKHMCSGIVASVHASGAVRIASSSGVDAARAIGDYVYTYIARRLPASHSPAATKSVVCFKALLDPSTALRVPSGVDTSEEAADWLRNRIQSLSATSDHMWWRAVDARLSSVSALRNRRSLRVTLHFANPRLCGHRTDNGDENGTARAEHDADAFFLGSEMMSVAPLGSVFGAMGHTPNGCGAGVEQGKTNAVTSQENEHYGAEETGGEEGEEEKEEESAEGWNPQVEVGRISETAPLGHKRSRAESESRSALLLCPMGQKLKYKVEAFVYRTGRVNATADTMEGLAFFVEEIVLPLFKK